MTGQKLRSTDRSLREKFFSTVLKQAEKAANKDEVPIGAAIVCENRIIASAHNLSEKRGHFAAHAEIIAIERAAKKLKTKYLQNCELYISVEPCLMCRYAARLSRIKKIYFLARSQKFGRKGSAYPKTQVRAFNDSDLTQRSINLLQSFFQKKR